MDGNLLGILSLELLGSVSGAVLALVFLPPATKTEFMRRFSLSTIAGMLWGDLAREYFKWPDIWQMYLAASAIVAMLSWFGVGTLIRLVNMWKPPKDE